VNKLMTSMI